MARKSDLGRYIISASEVGSFIVCQEAWRLRELAKVQSKKNERSDEGSKLHLDWAKQFDEASYLRNAVRLIVLLMLIAILFHLIMGAK